MGALLSLSGNEREVGWDGRLIEVSVNSRFGAYSNKYGSCFCFFCFFVVAVVAEVYCSFSSLPRCSGHLMGHT